MRDSKLVNEIWDNIHHTVLEVSGGNVVELNCCKEKDFDKMISQQSRNHDYYKEFGSYNGKVTLNDQTYYWTVYYN